jgi:hypothetical protein
MRTNTAVHAHLHSTALARIEHCCNRDLVLCLALLLSCRPASCHAHCFGIMAGDLFTHLCLDSSTLAIGDCKMLTTQSSMQAVRRNASTDIGNAISRIHICPRSNRNGPTQSASSARLSTVTCPRVMVGGTCQGLLTVREASHRGRVTMMTMTHMPRYVLSSQTWICGKRRMSMRCTSLHSADSLGMAQVHICGRHIGVHAHDLEGCRSARQLYDQVQSHCRLFDARELPQVHC